MSRGFSQYSIFQLRWKNKKKEEATENNHRTLNSRIWEARSVSLPNDSLHNKQWSEAITQLSWSNKCDMGYGISSKQWKKHVIGLSKLVWSKLVYNARYYIRIKVSIKSSDIVWKIPLWKKEYTVSVDTENTIKCVLNTDCTCNCFTYVFLCSIYNTNKCHLKIIFGKPRLFLPNVQYLKRQPVSSTTNAAINTDFTCNCFPMVFISYSNHGIPKIALMCTSSTTNSRFKCCFLIYIK